MYRMTMALLMLLGSMGVVAQTKYDIKGTIADKETTEAVEGATVQLLSLPDSAFVKGAVADLKGTFSLKDIRKADFLHRICDKICRCRPQRTQGQDRGLGQGGDKRRRPHAGRGAGHCQCREGAGERRIAGV